MNPPEMIIFLLEMQAQLQILHWQTTKYARHEAYGKTYQNIQDLSDTFIEIYQGKYDRIFIDENTNTIQLYNIDDQELANYLDECSNNIINMASILNQKDTD